MTLPIFLMIFAGVVWMGQAYSHMVENDVRATFKMWDGATSVQHHRVPGSYMYTLHPTSGGGVAAAGNADSIIQGGGLSGVDDGFAAVSNGALAVHGTHGQSSIYLLPIQSQVGSEVHPQASAHLKKNGSTKHGEFANSVMNDGPFSSGSPSTSGSGAGKLSKFGISLPTNIDQGKQGFVQSIGANARYGDIFAEVSNDHDIGNIGTLTFQSKFDVMVAPYAPDGEQGFTDGPVADEGISALLNRVMALDSNQHCFMAEVPGIQNHNRFANCNR
jgi:hypothetical protein